MAKMTFGASNGNHGKWDVFTTMLSIEDLSELLSKNVCAKGEEIWDTDFYLGDVDSAPLQRKPTTARTEPLKRYVKSNIVGAEASYAGALPALSVAVMGDVAPASNGGVEIKWDNNFKAILVDGMGRFSSLRDLYVNEGLNLNIPVTFYTMEDLDEEGCRQVLHDFNRYSTTMRPVSASVFDSNDILRPFTTALAEALQNAGFKFNAGHLSTASYMFYTTNDRLYSAQKDTKSRRHLDKSQVKDDLPNVKTIATWVCRCIDFPEAKKKKLTATTLQNLLHGLSQVRECAIEDVRNDYIKPFVSVGDWNVSLRTKEVFDRNQKLLNLRKF